MTPYYSDDWLTILQGDVRDVLPTLPADSVDCIVTSPPFWGLRDYGTGTWSGGDPACKHRVGGQVQDSKWEGAITTGQRPGVDASRCRDCGAEKVDRQIGLERTPEEYVANMVGIFRELRRVLKPSGTCWLNLGDSYSGIRGNTADKPGFDNKAAAGHANLAVGVRKEPGLGPKQLVGIPWRVAFALQADGWYLRSDIIWSKPNPMPESVTDRPTKAHEYLFLLTKSARYYFDADAVREDGAGRLDRGKAARGRFGEQGWRQEPLSDPAGRNLRSVWTIATRPYPGSHFAVFPPELPERCIKAGSSERGVCPECGAPWERVVERVTSVPRRVGGPKTAGADIHNDHKRPGGFYPDVPNTTGWQPACSHEAETCRRCDFTVPCLDDCVETEHWHCVRCPAIRGTRRRAKPGLRLPQPVPAVILDPFAGSGTTGMVANRLSRRAILIDLNGDYLKQQLKRNAQTPLGLGAA